jgi:hypothetical protein
MKFVQLIEYTTSRPDEVRAAVEEFLAASEATRSETHGMTGKDRDRPNVFINIVEFPSYEVAMKNSERPETQQLAERLQKLCDGPPTFRNLDITFEET